ncbi:MAG: hypothetical protein CM1200mP23_0470 [Nitrososphaerota archaeon]|nr:MAG: hypothetical protein CM1200mP23_0470 [Nitrososphaerota archaeon]
MVLQLVVHVVGQMGVLAKDEVCVRQPIVIFLAVWDIWNQTYLASPLFTAASAITGKLTDPRDL